ncbi:hypothetical protein GCM10010493_72920 [Streptomyces lavendulae subsp. grasserius]
MLLTGPVPALNEKLRIVISGQESEAGRTAAAERVARALSPEAIDALTADARESGPPLDGRDGYGSR